MTRQSTFIVDTAAPPPWAPQVKHLRARGMRIRQIAEIVGVPPSWVVEVVNPRKTYVRETSYAPAPLPERPVYVETPPPYLEVVKDICAVHGFTLADVRAPNRWKRLVACRHEVMRYLVNERGWTVSATGRFLQRDHTTVLHAIGRISKRRKA